MSYRAHLRTPFNQSHWVSLISAFWVVAGSACSTPSQTFHDQSSSDVEVRREFISHPDAPSKRVEFYWAKPEGLGPWPVLIFIHGHQEPERPGGRDMLRWGLLRRLVQRGVVVVAFSQPGYGQSDGPPDYCGPFTQRALFAVLSETKKWNFVKVDRIGLYGVSRGATVAGMVVAQQPDLAAAVLVVGSYDLEKDYKRLLKEGQRNERSRAISENMRIETQGAGTESLKRRSVIRWAKDMRTPTLILAGAKDDRVDSSVAQSLGERIRANGVFSKVVIYPEFGHLIPMPVRSREITPFLEERLGISPSGWLTD